MDQGHKCRCSFNRASWFLQDLSHLQLAKPQESGQQWPGRQGQRSQSHLRFVKEKLHEVFAEQLPGVRSRKTVPEFQSSGAWTNCSTLGPLAKCSWQMRWPTPLSEFFALQSKVRCNFDLLSLANCSDRPLSAPIWGQFYWKAFDEGPAVLGMVMRTHGTHVQGPLSALYWGVINVLSPPQSVVWFASSSLLRSDCSWKTSSIIKA